eukprot:3855052-Prymnesium_polylepis.1
MATGRALEGLRSTAARHHGTTSAGIGAYRGPRRRWGAAGRCEYITRERTVRGTTVRQKI